jgi:metal-responsive CopG/Arc/MetJ family transcriptional regulator
MPSQKPQFTIVADEETLKEIEDFRYEKRFPNRSKAINHLIKKGLEAVKQEQEKEKNGERP